MNTTKLQSIVKYYRDARQERNNASIRNDLNDVAYWNDELTYWSTKLDEEMENIGIELSVVSKMINA